MKKLLMLTLAGSCGLLWAQTNLPVVPTNAVPAADVAAVGAHTNRPAVSAKPVEPTVITSDSGDFDQQRLIYLGHVKVTGPEADLSCALLTVDLPPGGGHVNHAFAETNVVIDFVQNAKKYHVTAAKAVYDYQLVTNQTLNVVTNGTVDLGTNATVAVDTNATITLATNEVVNLTTNETVTLTGSPKVESVDGTMTGEPMVWNRATGHFFGTDIKIIGVTTNHNGTNGSPMKLF